jgi:DNA-binding SARP family transcriptional activator
MTSRKQTAALAFADSEQRLGAWAEQIAGRFRQRNFAECALEFPQPEFHRGRAVKPEVATAMYALAAFGQVPGSEAARWFEDALATCSQPGNEKSLLTIGVLTAGRQLWWSDAAQPYSRVARAILPLEQALNISEAAKLAWLAAKAHCELLYADPLNPGSGALAVARALTAIQAVGLEPDHTPVSSAALVHTLITGELDEARAYFQRTAGLASRLTPYDSWLRSFYKCWLYVAAREREAAVIEAARGLVLAARSGTPHSMPWARYAAARAAVDSGVRDASRQIAAARLAAVQCGNAALLALCRLVAALHALRGRSPARAGVLAAAALAELERLGLLQPLLITRADIEAAYACALRDACCKVPRLLQLHAISEVPRESFSSRADCEIRIHCLGSFRIYKRGEPLRWPRKQPRRPLELLKAVIAGGGDGALVADISESLWPGMDGDHAHRALTSALHRLRALLGPNALVLSGARLAVDSRYVWVDAFEFEARLSNDAPPSETAEALQLYQGEFLSEDRDAEWSARARDRLKQRYRHATRAAGDALLARGRWRDALDLFEEALRRDAQAEMFYQGAIAACLAGGLREQASSWYQRCRSVLAQDLGLKPSPKTEALYLAVLQSEQTR